MLPFFVTSTAMSAEVAAQRSSAPKMAGTTTEVETQLTRTAISTMSWGKVRTKVTAAKKVIVHLGARLTVLKVVLSIVVVYVHCDVFVFFVSFFLCETGN